MAVNAKAVIDIELNDQAFKKFGQDFERFQKSVAKMPVMKGMSEEAKKAAASFDKLAASMTKLSGDAKKAATHTKDMAHYSAMISKGWDSASKHATHFATKIKDSTLWLLKWTGIFGMVGGVLSSVTTLFGLTSMAAAARRDRAQSAGLGLSYGEMKALEHGFGHQMNIGSLEQGVATAKADRQSEAYRAMRLLGINPRGMTAMDANRATIDELYRIAQSGGNFGEIINRRKLGALGVDVNTLNTLQRMSPEEFAKKRGEIGPEGVKGFNVSDKALGNWEKFINFLDQAGEKIKSILLEQLGDKVMPKLTELTAKITEWLEKFFKSGGFEKAVDAMVKGFEIATKWLSSPDGFAHWLELVTDALKKLYKVLVWITDPFDDAGARKARTDKEKEIGDAAQSSAIRKWFERYAPWLMNAPPSLSAPPDPDETKEREGYEGQPNTRARAGQRRSGSRTRFWDRQSQRGGFGGSYGGGGGGGGGQVSGDWSKDIRQLMGLGWSKEQALGIVANLNDESGGNIKAVGDSGLAYGLAQWHPDRQALFRKVMGVDIRNSTRAQQIAFVDWELNHSEKLAGSMLKATRNHRQAAGVFSRYYERPAAADEAAANRGNTADVMSAKYGNITVDVIVQNQTGADVNVATAGAVGR